jgi:predicted XRE-type DNA-binding protein
MTMTTKKRGSLKAAGWQVGDAAEFLGLSADEKQLVEVRLALALSIRRQRHESGLSQKQLADRIGTSQPRIAKIEVAAADVSLDQLVRAYTAAGGRIECTSKPNAAARKLTLRCIAARRMVSMTRARDTKSSS